MKKSIPFILTFLLFLAPISSWGSEGQEIAAKSTKESVYVSEVINGGEQLRLSDNSLYEVAPEDWVKAQAWIVPTEIQVTMNNNEFYPFTLINPLSGYSVAARLLYSEKPTPLTPQKKNLIEEAVKEYQDTES